MIGKEYVIRSSMELCKENLCFITNSIEKCLIKEEKGEKQFEYVYSNIENEDKFVDLLIGIDEEYKDILSTFDKFIDFIDRDIIMKSILLSVNNFNDSIEVIFDEFILTKLNYGLFLEDYFRYLQDYDNVNIYKFKHNVKITIKESKCYFNVVLLDIINMINDIYKKIIFINNVASINNIKIKEMNIIDLLINKGCFMKEADNKYKLMSKYYDLFTIEDYISSIDTLDYNKVSIKITNNNKPNYINPYEIINNRYNIDFGLFGEVSKLLLSKLLNDENTLSSSIRDDYFIINKLIKNNTFVKLYELMLNWLDGMKHARYSITKNKCNIVNIHIIHLDTNSYKTDEFKTFITELINS